MSSKQDEYDCQKVASMEETENALTLASFGALLRERRIRKGLSEESVAAELKITSRLVKAIEDGDKTALPHAVYARGFLRSYARLLSVDDGLTHEACALLKDPEETLREQENSVAAAPRGESRVPWLGIVLCAAFLAGGAWYLRDVIPGLFAPSESLKSAPIQQASPTLPEKPSESAAPAALSSEPVANATMPATPEAPIVLGGTPLPAENATVPVPEAAVPATGHRVFITADGDCWISTTADGKNSQKILHKGDTLSVDFEEKLVMKLGNAGAVRVAYDGKDLPPIGKPGRVKKVTFPDDFQE